ncbi:probable plastid-lipid-associated protein 4, chloroplastic isoform X4 [Lycium barbarum]|uniref:probable plastid-lipid-associated protein 4, chloroplastic isoform X4 n=1 Tax=Lycium barbarum TaxID=112863 RepID=UPI00293F099D|nr:probable plastid-lipid-associated protein 4, chloroplastic isoform X4 [Lycium barbarum]
MALSSLSPPKHVATQSTYSIPKLYYSHSTTLSFPAIQNPHNITTSPLNQKWRTHVSFFPAFFNKTKDATHIKQELLEAIAPLDRGAEASPEDQEIIDQIAGKLEVCNPTKEPLKSSLLNGKWELIYTTSKSILQTQRPKILRSRVNYQAINVDTLRAQNMEGWPFFNQIPIKAPGRAQGELEMTYLDEELRSRAYNPFPELALHHFDRVSRGDLGNLFVLKMVDPSYKVPT